MTTRYHSIFDTDVGLLMAPGTTPASMEELHDVVRYIKRRADDAVSFDIGDLDGLPPTDVVHPGQSFPYSPMWIEFTHEKYVFCVYVFNDVSQGGFQIVVFRKHGRAWGITSQFLFILGQKAGYRVHDALRDTSDREFANYITGVITSFLAALACVNVVPVETPAPAKLNKKRAKSGKKPILSHWTLVIKNRNGAVSTVGGGTHASPRLHLRRGHIREYVPGKYTWVQPHVVGTNKDGIITKDYRLEVGV